LIRHNHTDLVAPLLAIVFDDEDNPRFRSFAVQHLWRLSADGRTDGVEGITAGLRLASRNGPLPVRREAFLGLVRNGDREASETAVKLLTGEAGEGMRDLAVRCVREMGLTNQVDAIRRLVGSANESEQIAALVTVGQWRDKDSRSVVEAACKSKSERVRRAAATALAAIDGAM
jgi:HEAT repeat protein